MNTTKNKHTHTYLYGYSVHCTLHTYIKKNKIVPKHQNDKMKSEKSRLI